jgi:hypothetical protein
VTRAPFTEIDLVGATSPALRDMRAVASWIEVAQLSQPRGLLQCSQFNWWLFVNRCQVWLHGPDDLRVHRFPDVVLINAIDRVHAQHTAAGYMLRGAIRPLRAGILTSDECTLPHVEPCTPEILAGDSPRYVTVQSMLEAARG